ncbi:MAG: radical SAM protein, partial [Defluviitaleaceae bacterium]|nr:radical SAM protein [Defluviitaleaceae bacterium]
YACSPERSGGYMSKSVAEDICVLLREGGCRSIHIGGGEPFIDFDGLIELIQTASNAGIAVEYVETNAFWAIDEHQIEQRLRAILRAGADTLCISLDPFHAEYVPVRRPLFLAEVCRRIGFGFFLWQERYLPVLSCADPDKTHDRAELERLISPDYVLGMAQGYGLHFGGRAINIEEEYSERKPVDAIKDSRPCRRLLSSDHFHVDLNSMFIPPGCMGLVIPLQEAVRGIPDGKYPVFEALLTGGTAELLQYAQARGFAENPQGYTSNCALCFHIRHWLCVNDAYPELVSEHYSESLKYYN